VNGKQEPGNQPDPRVRMQTTDQPPHEDCAGGMNEKVGQVEQPRSRVRDVGQGTQPQSVQQRELGREAEHRHGLVQVSVRFEREQFKGVRQRWSADKNEVEDKLLVVSLDETASQSRQSGCHGREKNNGCRQNASRPGCGL